MVDETIYEIADAYDYDDLKKMKSGDAVTIPRGVSLGAKSGKAELNGGKIQPSTDDGRKEDAGDGGRKKKTTEKLFDRNLEERTKEQQRNVDKLHRHLSSSTLGNKSVVAVRVKTTDAIYSSSEEVLRREVFGIGEDEFNLSSGYDQCSYGALTFTPLASHSSGGVSIENGVVTIEVNVQAIGNGHGSVRNAVTNKIKEIFGSNMQSVADYWMCECARLVFILVQLFFVTQS